MVPCSIENRQQIRNQSRWDPGGPGLQRSKIKRQPHSNHEEEEGGRRGGQADVPQGAEAIRELERAQARRQPRPDGAAGDGQQGKEYTLQRAHHPGEAEAPDEAVHHDGQHDAAHGAPGGHDAVRGGAASRKPRRHARHGRAEDGAGADPRGDGLREEELVVLCAEGHHDQPEEEEGRAGPQEPLRPVVVKDSPELLGEQDQRVRKPREERMRSGEGQAYNRAGRYHEECLDGRDPADGGGVVVRQRPRGVVFDKHAGAVEQPKGAKGGAPAAEHDEPCAKAAVGVVGVVAGFCSRCLRVGARDAVFQYALGRLCRSRLGLLLAKLMIGRARAEAESR